MFPRTTPAVWQAPGHTRGTAGTLSGVMPPAVRLVPERSPRRARYLIPLGTPRRGEVLVALAVVAALAAALLVPLMLLLLVVFYVTSKISRWRPVWLAVPACSGAVWLLAVGPGTAVAA